VGGTTVDGAVWPAEPEPQPTRAIPDASNEPIKSLVIESIRAVSYLSNSPQCKKKKTYDLIAANLTGAMDEARQIVNRCDAARFSTIDRHVGSIAVGGTHDEAHDPLRLRPGRSRPWPQPEAKTLSWSPTQGL
jgi:hypothetical protein